MDKIHLENIILYGYHGCLPEERVLGTNYKINVTLWLDLSKASESDQLEDTLNYALVYDIIRQEMKVPSNLLEHVAGRINRHLLQKFGELKRVTTTICKLSPPISGQLDGVCVEITQESR